MHPEETFPAEPAMSPEAAPNRFENETPNPPPEARQAAAPAAHSLESTPFESTSLESRLPPDSPETRFLKWSFVGQHGIRSGWLVAIFVALTLIFATLLSLLASLIVHNLLHLKFDKLSAPISIMGESIQFFSLLAAAAVMALIEKRRIRDYNLSGPRRTRRFLEGTISGYVVLSLLVAALLAGHWIGFAGHSLSGLPIFEFAALWGIAFLLTGLSEEGMVRCYMLFTLARGTNFWWALGSIASFCLFALLNPKGNGAGGVYAMALLGLIPCLLLHITRTTSSRFWQAAWLTSTFFGYIHTFNDGETWIGIFSAAAIGFVLCVSVYLTGSAWWAIGYHAAWDWAQTYFYGTPDSGFAFKGHYLNTNPLGPALWSGGPDGPEGSLLVIGAIVLTLIFLGLVYRRKNTLPLESPSTPAQPQLS